MAFEPGLGDEMDELVHKEDWDDQDKTGSEGRETPGLHNCVDGDALPEDKALWKRIKFVGEDIEFHLNILNSG